MSLKADLKRLPTDSDLLCLGAGLNAVFEVVLDALRLRFADFVRLREPSRERLDMVPGIAVTVGFV